MKIRTLIIKGKGDSLWGASKGPFRINELEVDLDPDWNGKAKNFWGELRVYGADSDWFQYTDSLIPKSLRKKATFMKAFRKALQARLDSFGVKHKLPKSVKFGWSEQGMQPDGGWSFDIFV